MQSLHFYKLNAMKKIFLMALVMIASAMFTTVSAGNKKDKKQQPAPTTLVLATLSDSLSYASGMSNTNGLLPYIRQQYGVDSTYIADFVKGFEEAMGKNDDLHYTAYSAGIQIADMVKKRILPQVKSMFEGSKDSIDSKLFEKGFVAGVLNDTAHYTMSTAETFCKEIKEEAFKQKNKAYLDENKTWLAANAKKEGVKTTASGLQYKVITQGTGETPQSFDSVTVKYEGKTIDGNVFDSSYKRNPQTAKFRCDQVIKGWTEALTMMPAGSKWELYIPQELAYGARQAGQIKPYSTLIFTVELVSVDKPQASVESSKPAVSPKKPARKKK